MGEIELDVETGDLPDIDGEDTEIEIETSETEPTEVTVIVESEGDETWETEPEPAQPEVAQAIAEAMTDAIQQSEIERLQTMVTQQSEQISQLQNRLDSELTSLWMKVNPPTAPETEAENEAEVSPATRPTRSKKSLLMKLLT